MLISHHQEHIGEFHIRDLAITPEGQSRSNPRVLTSICASISEQLGISGRAFVTFPEYELATGWRFQTIFDTFQESNTAAEKRENAWKSA